MQKADSETEVVQSQQAQRPSVDTPATEDSQGTENGASKISPQNKRITSTDRTESLYLHAKDRSAKLQEKLQAENKECTFQPELFTKSSSIKVTTPFEDRQKEVLNRRQETAKKVADIEMAQFTGAPDLSVTMDVNNKVSAQKNEEGKPRYETLHQKHFTQKDRMKEKEKRIYKDYTFQPQLYTKESKSPRVQVRLQKDVFERLAEDQQNAKTSDSAEKKQERDTQGCTFSPELATKNYARPTCQNAADTTGAEEPFHDRLYKVASQRKVNMEKKKSELDKAATEGCTFSPEITEKALNRTPSDPEMKAYDRLYKKADESKQKKEELRATLTLLADSDCTYAPQLCSPRSRAQAEEANRLEELYKLGVQKQQNRGPHVEPTTNVSAAIFASDGVIISNAKDNTAAARNRLEEDQLQECTFQPVLATKKLTKKTSQPSNNSSADSPSVDSADAVYA